MGEESTQAGGAQPELLPAASDPRVHPYRLAVEASLRLHRMMDPEGFPRVAVQTVQSVLGPVEGFLLLANPAAPEIHPLGRALPEWASRPALLAVAAKAGETGTPVVDGAGDERVLIAPLVSGLASYGAVLLDVSGLEKRFGGLYVDLLALISRHLGLALDNCRRIAGLGIMAEGGEAAAPPSSGVSFKAAREGFERSLIIARLREAGGNIAVAARSLEMDRGQLSRLLKRYGIDKEDCRPRGGGAARPQGG